MSDGTLESLRKVVERRGQLGAAVIRPKGKITVGELAPALREIAQELVDQKNNHMVIDMSEVTFIDSSGLGTLIYIYNLFRERGGDLMVAGVGSSVAGQLSLTRIDEVVPIYEGVEEALASIAVD